MLRRSESVGRGLHAEPQSPRDVVGRVAHEGKRHSRPHSSQAMGLPSMNTRMYEVAALLAAHPRYERDCEERPRELLAKAENLAA